MGKRAMKIILLPQRSVRKSGAQFLMREVVLNLCLKKSQCDVTLVF